MKIAHDVKLLRLIKFVPPLLVIAFAVMVILLVINNNQIKLNNDLNTLREDFISSRKSMVKAQVKQLVEQINYEKASTQAVLKESIKEHIYLAHTIASNIYEKNKTKSEREVTELLKSALRDIRFNNGRGYFFIYETSGKNVLHPVLPKIEGTQKINLQDSRGNYIVRDMGQLAKRHGETYYTWWFVKPDDKTKEFKKIGFGKYFAPYDWFIGTGEYVVDVEKDIQTALINQISNIRYGENGYAFLLNTQGDVLAHIDKTLENTNLLDHAHYSNLHNEKQLIDLPKQGGGFIHYNSHLMPSTNQPANKISYIQSIEQWQWIIGMGFFENEIDSQLLLRKKEVTKLNKHQFFDLLWLSSIVTLFFIFLSLFLSNYLSKRFKNYEKTIHKDFDELNKVKLASEYQALHDDLTELPNRLSLNQHIYQGIKRSKQYGKKLAVIFADLDDFKKVNDLHGHSVGDNLLKLLGEHFNKVIGEKDTVARFGGDEFIFCYPGLTDISEAEEKVQQILAIFKHQFNLDGKPIFSTCSLGVAMYPRDGKDPETLISKADTALYTSKFIKKGQALFFNNAIAEQVKRDFTIETELRQALEKNEITVFYQPQMSVNSGCILGVEALIRWHNAVLGHVSPAEFIPIAEKSGLIKALGEFVLSKAMSQIKQFNSKNSHPVMLSVNISPTQLLEPNFINSVVQLRDEIGFNPDQITLEVTENVLISDLSQVQPILTALKEHDFKLSLDDFGTGYSSLSYLSNLPMDEIKIDRSFIDKLLTNNQSESLVQTIIAIGEFCNLTVVAEGVETHAQYERLIDYKCDLIQGYYFDKPLSYEALEAKYKTCIN